MDDTSIGDFIQPKFGDIAWLIEDVTLSAEAFRAICYLQTKTVGWVARPIDMKAKLGFSERTWRRVSGELRDRQILVITMNPEGKRLHYLHVCDPDKQIAQGCNPCKHCNGTFCTDAKCTDIVIHVNEHLNNLKCPDECLEGIEDLDDIHRLKHPRDTNISSMLADYNLAETFEEQLYARDLSKI